MAKKLIDTNPNASTQTSANATSRNPKSISASALYFFREQVETLHFDLAQQESAQLRFDKIWVVFSTLMVICSRSFLIFTVVAVTSLPSSKFCNSFVKERISG